MDINVIEPPNKPLVGKKYTVEVDRDEINEFRRYVRRIAIVNEMHGYTDENNNSQVIILLMTTDSKLLQKVERKITEKFDVNIIESIDWDKPILMGFETKREHRLSRNEIRQMLRENVQLERENERLIKRYSEIQKSRFWRITAPFRFVLHNLKQLFRKITSKSN